MWRIATSLPYPRTAGPNAGLHVPTYVLGIGRQNPCGSIDNLCGNLYRDHHSVDSFLSLIKFILVLSSKSLLPSHNNTKVVNSFHPDFSTHSRRDASLGWEKGLMQSCGDMTNIALVPFWPVLLSP
jgi:hypothetical protein